MKESESESTEEEGEANSPLSREPDVGLDLRTFGSQLDRKRTLNQLSHLGAPRRLYLAMLIH